MSISGRYMKRIQVGPKKPKIVSKIRRTKEQAYTSDWAVISEYVLSSAGYACKECGAKRADGARLEAHHVIPVAKGGQTVLFNLRCICSKCHDKKHAHLRK